MNRPPLPQHRARYVLALLLGLALVASACGDDDDDTADTGGDGAAPASCAVGDLALNTPGTLTVATGESVFPPWMEDGDPDPVAGQGFEGALVAALAEQMGFTADQVAWARTGFDESIAPGDKPYDFNIQQFSITAERDEVVDFSIGYYDVEQALIALADSAPAAATSVAELQTTLLGAAIGTTSLDYIETIIQPDNEAAVYDDNSLAVAAFKAGQIEGIVVDLPTAYFLTAVEVPEASIVGVLPRTDSEPEQLGMLFEDGSPLVPCVNEALQALIDAGTVAALEEQWLAGDGAIPTLTAG